MTAIFEEFAASFIGEVCWEEDIALASTLERGLLDFSPGSLDLVDKYLTAVCDAVANDKIEQVNELNNTVLWGGAYVGEVLRRARPEWSWLDYDDYIANNPNSLKAIGPRSLGTTAFLVKGADSMCMPLNKVLRFIKEGPDNSTRAFFNTFA